MKSNLGSNGMADEKEYQLRLQKVKWKNSSHRWDTVVIQWMWNTTIYNNIFLLLNSVGSTYWQYFGKHLNIKWKLKVKSIKVDASHSHRLAACVMCTCKGLLNLTVKWVCISIDNTCVCVFCALKLVVALISATQCAAQLTYLSSLSLSMQWLNRSQIERLCFVLIFMVFKQLFNKRTRVSHIGLTFQYCISKRNKHEMYLPHIVFIESFIHAGKCTSDFELQNKL